jgi:hypothetical protein
MTGVGVMSPGVVGDMPVVVARVEVGCVVRELVDTSVGLEDHEVTVSCVKLLVATDEYAVPIPIYPYHQQTAVTH